jgi:hypothetical protein
MILEIRKVKNDASSMTMEDFRAKAIGEVLASTRTSIVNLVQSHTDRLVAELAAKKAAGTTGKVAIGLSLMPSDYDED